MDAPMLRILCLALVAFVGLTPVVTAQIYTLPELGLQNSGACPALAARERTSKTMVPLGCLNTSSKTWTLTPGKVTLPAVDQGSTGDVSGMSVTVPGENVARTLLGRLADIPLSVDSFRGGACAGAVDDTCAVQAAIAAASSQKRELLLPGGTLTTGAINFPSGVTIRGRGEGVTTLKLKNGTNRSLLTSGNAYSLYGTGSEGGFFDFSLSDLTLDGNRANNTSGDCLAIYGARFRLRNLTIKQCPDIGLRTEWGQYGDFPMEASFNNIRIDTTGANGADLRGPHDSILDNIVIVDAGQKANNFYSQLLISGFMNGRFSKVHTWHRSTVANRTIYGVYDESGSNDFTNSHFEGSLTAPAYIGGNFSQYSDSVLYYAPWGDGSSSIILAGKNNKVNGTILGSTFMPGQPPRIGVYQTNNASGNIVNLMVLGSTIAAIDVSVGDSGYNDYKIRGAQSTGPGFLGLFADTSSVDIQMFGATSNSRIAKDASIAPPASSGAACTYGQRAFDTNFEYRCVSANSWKRAPLSTWP